MSLQSGLLKSVSRTASLSSELPRQSLDLSSSPCTRKRRSSADIRAARTDQVLATSVICREGERGVVIEVGQSCDFAETRRILERSYRTDTPQLDTEYDSEFWSEEEVETASIDPRSHLEQRWQAQSEQGEKDRPSQAIRRRGDRRRQLNTLTSLRSSTSNRHRTRTVGGVRAQRNLAGRLEAHSSRSRDVADQLYLARLKLGLSQRRNKKSKDIAPMLGSIFNNWGDTGLLDREAEAELGRIVQAGLCIHQQLDAKRAELGREMCSEEKESTTGIPLDKIQLRLRNMQLARHLLIQFNMRLLAKVARQFEGRGMEMEDLIVEGTQGLERAIDRFDPSKGYKFSTYAYMWIRQAVSRCISEYARVVRLPGHVFESVGRIHKMRQLLASKSPTGEATDEQVAAALGLPLEKVVTYSQASKCPQSLDAILKPLKPDGDRNPMTLADALQDPTPSPVEELLEEENLNLIRQDVDSVLNGLSLRERNVLRYRYGLHTNAVSLADLSAAYGLTKERIRQIGEIALAKLQLRQASQGQRSLNGRVRNVSVLNPEVYGYR